MNNKYARIGLICAVVIVWGIIVFKLVQMFSEKDNLPEQTMALNNNVADGTTVLPDTVELLLNYPDPFLGGKLPEVQQQASNAFTPNQERSLPNVPEVQMPMPTVKYFGLVANRETQKMVAIVTVAGKQYLAKQGDLLGEIAVLKITKDSIYIAYEKNKKWICK